MQGGHWPLPGTGDQSGVTYKRHSLFKTLSHQVLDEISILCNIRRSRVSTVILQRWAPESQNAVEVGQLETTPQWAMDKDTHSLQQLTSQVSDTYTTGLTPVAGIRSIHASCLSNWHSGHKFWRTLSRSRELWPLQLLVLGPQLAPVADTTGHWQIPLIHTGLTSSWHLVLSAHVHMG